MELLSLQALWAILAIILIDVVLAGDNALIIGMAASRLPEHLRKKAILWGTAGAIGVRFVSVAILTYLLLIPGLRFIGGLALLWIGWKLATDHEHKEVKSADTFWKAIGTIVVADAVMGIDNALGIAAAAHGNFALIIFGLLISVPIILFGAGVVSKIIAKHPQSVFVGSFVLLVVAVQMILKEPMLQLSEVVHAQVLQFAPWIIGLLTTAIQYSIVSKKARVA